MNGNGRAHSATRVPSAKIPLQKVNVVNALLRPNRVKLLGSEYTLMCG